jgi:hypothetical protein
MTSCGLTLLSLKSQSRPGASLSMATPNGMVHEDKNQGGMGVTSLLTDYVQTTAALLTKALNDQGRLGVITHALLPIQLQRAGHELSDEMANSLTYSRLVRSLMLLKNSGLSLVENFGSPNQTEPTWGANQLARLLAALPATWQGHGIHTEFPTHVRTTLWELGINSLDQLLLADGRHMVPASQLAEHLTRQGLPTPNSRIKARHKQALNCLTRLLNGTLTSVKAPGKHTSVTDIPLEGRRVRASDLFCDTAQHTEPIRAYNPTANSPCTHSSRGSPQPRTLPRGHQQA